MTPDLYRRAGEIYHAALALPADRRPAFLEGACGGDRDLLVEVRSLLAAHAEAGEFIETPHEEASVLMESILSDTPRQTAAAGGALSADAPESLLTTGQRLGRYQILDLLGSGGMGRVYRALDPGLGREVAIKALSRAFRGDLASQRRFEREARVLAALSHPNIATIYGFERLDGAPYLVLERVHGETLSERLLGGAMPVAQAVEIARQMVAGLEEAHARGVIHRDLKPSNVMLTPDGRVKLVDFGLAKAIGASVAGDDSAGSITAAGVVLGTARYMSPEQVRGENVDTRTDVWSFGCVLYEMLTAHPAFAGRSVSEVVAAVLRDDPDWRAVPASTPRAIERLLRRCLRRDPHNRLQHIGDARLDLIESDDSAPDGASARRSKMSWLVPAIIVTALAAIVGTLAFARWTRSAAVASPARVSVELPSRITIASEFSAPFALAPTGSAVVFEAVENGTQRLYVRDINNPIPRALGGTDGARQPFFSPDGEWVGFFANRKLSKVPIGGGAVLQLADIGGNPRGAAWIPDGTIVVAPTQTSGLERVPDAGGKLIPLTSLVKATGEYSHRWPDVLPGGKWVLFTVGLEDASFDEARIEAVSIATGERRVVVAGAGYARYVPGGRLLFIRAGRLHAVGFDPDRIAILGAPEVVLDPVRYDWRNGGGHLAVSASGMLMYSPGTPSSLEYYLAWADRDGHLSRATETARAFRDIKASPDGRRMAAVIGTSTDSDLWAIDANGTLSQLTFGLSPHRPTWTANGAAITVGAQRNGKWQLLTVAPEGRQEPTVLFEGAYRLYPNSWSPDGRYLIFQESRPETGWDLRILDVDGSGQAMGEPRAFAETPFHEGVASISLDGRWVAYESDELDGVVQIYVRSFPDGAHKVQASPEGGRWPAWDTHGNLFYWQTGDNKLRMVSTQAEGNRLQVSTHQSAWRSEVEPGMLRRMAITVAFARYDVDPSGSRFLVLEHPVLPSEPELSHPIAVVGWAPAASAIR
jgi:serine/threonine protein kinase/Tol biopolymer transport system component